MLKRNITFAAIALALAFVTTAAYADTYIVTTVDQVYPMTDRTNRNDFGITVASGLSNDDVDEALYVGGVYSHGFSPWFALGLEAGWQEADFDTTDDNDLAMVTVFGDIIGRLPLANSPIVPYGVIGLGAIHAYTDTSSNDDDETAFAAKLGLGLDWFLNSNWILNFEGAYIATGAEINAGTTNTAELDHWRVGGGLKYAY